MLVPCGARKILSVLHCSAVDTFYSFMVTESLPGVLKTDAWVKDEHNWPNVASLAQKTRL